MATCNRFFKHSSLCAKLFCVFACACVKCVRCFTITTFVAQLINLPSFSYLFFYFSLSLFFFVILLLVFHYTRQFASRHPPVDADRFFFVVHFISFYFSCFPRLVFWLSCASREGFPAAHPDFWSRDEDGLTRASHCGAWCLASLRVKEAPKKRATGKSSPPPPTA